MIPMLAKAEGKASMPVPMDESSVWGSVEAEEWIVGRERKEGGEARPRSPPSGAEPLSSPLVLGWP